MKSSILLAIGFFTILSTFGIAKAWPYCSADEFQCVNTNVCISNSLKCNKESDCDFGDDEWECPMSKDGINPIPRSSVSNKKKDCKRDQMKCNNGQCIQAVFWCDGDNDCDDESDETDCPLPEIRAHNFVEEKMLRTRYHKKYPKKMNKKRIPLKK